MNPEPCADWAGTARHLSLTLAPILPQGGAGATVRGGRSLCIRKRASAPDGAPIDVYDHAAMMSAWKHGQRGRVPMPVPLDQLPECELCVLAAVKLAGATT